MSIRTKVASFFSGLNPLSGGVLTPMPKLRSPTEEELRNAMAYVDPSRLIANRLFTAYNPEILVLRKSLGIFDAMKRDEQVKAALKFKKDAAFSSGWEIVSPATQDEDWEVTRFVRHQFETFPGGWKKQLKKIALGLDYGYSITEKVYSEIAEGEWSGRVGISRLISCKPHYFDFLVGDHGELLAVIQRALPVTKDMGGGMEGDLAKGFPLFPPAKFVIFTHGEEFENKYGISDLVAAYRAWWVKDNAYKWFSIYLERYGMPPFIALYNIQAYQGNMLSQLKTFISRIATGTFGLIPRTNREDLELWKESIGVQSKEIYLEALRKFDQDISRALLVPAMIGMTSDEATGSLARSATHFDTFMLVLQDVQSDIASDAINAQLIPQLCDLNYPSLTEYPIFRFLPFKDQLRLEVLKTWGTMVKNKIVNRVEDDERHVRRTLGFPDNDSPVLEPLPTDASPDAKPVGEEELTQEEREFAEENFGVWIEVDGRRICVDEADLDLEA